MKLLVLSDLHLEFSDMQKPAAEADVVVLAGDIWQGDRGIYWARENWPDVYKRQGLSQIALTHI